MLAAIIIHKRKFTVYGEKTHRQPSLHISLNGKCPITGSVSALGTETELLFRMKDSGDIVEEQAFEVDFK